MEPTAVPTAPRGTLEDPEVLQNVPGHVIPILQREFDDFKTEATKFLEGQTPGGRVHQVPPQAGGVRAAPGRRADDPREAAVRGDHARADGEVRRRDREVRAAQQGPHHHAPEHPDAPHPAAGSRAGDPRAGRGGALQPRGVRQHRAQRHRRPVGGGGERRAVRHDPLRGGVRALLRAPPHHAGDAAQDQDGIRRQRAGQRAISEIHDIAFRARVREIDDPAHPARCAARRCSSAAAPRSCPAKRRCCTSGWGSTTAST